MDFVSDCVFCNIAAGDAPADRLREWDNAVAIRPLQPVARGHVLVLPKRHVTDFVDDPDVTAATMRRAAELARAWSGKDINLITSRGALATQSVFHLHVHLVVRTENDGLKLPWSS